MQLKRLDLIVAEQTNISRSFAAKLIESKKVKDNDKVLNKASKKYSDDIKLEIKFDKQEKLVQPIIDVIYDDDDVTVINKPEGLLTHSKGAYNPESTVATWLENKTIGFDDSDDRAGIVHRLDRATSGVMITAKNPKAQEYLQKQFASRNVKKTYKAVIYGQIDPPEAKIDIPIARNPSDPKKFMVNSFGKPALTNYKIIKTFTYKNQDYSLVELKPKSGRTHQLRVHLNYMKVPIVGDNFYGGINAERMYLHSTTLELTLPNSKRKIFESPLPKSFIKPKILSK